MTNKMNILLSNDDGINAPGLKLLHRMLVDLGHRVQVVAPSSEQSGTSHSITLNSPLIPKKITHDGHFFGFAVNGSPADCVKLGLCNLYPNSDLVIAGMNLGPNAGPAIYYSGTVAAAFEGLSLGKTALAISYNSFSEKALEGLPQRLAPFLPTLLDGCSNQLLYNINLPSTATIKEIRVTRQFRGFFSDIYEQRIDPRGREYFWLKGVSYSEETSANNGYLHDLEAIAAGYISVTPLQFDLTGYQELPVLQRLLHRNEMSE